VAAAPLAGVAAIDPAEANASRAAVGRAIAGRVAETSAACGLAVLGHGIAHVNRQWKESHA
jgi:hypothetical protein